MFRNTLLTASILLIAHHVLAAEAETKPDKRPTKIWNRTGPLGEPPKHVTDACPLSDQDNKGGWAKFEPMTDEFEGQDLDLNKWNRGMYWWKGRQTMPQWFGMPDDNDLPSTFSVEYVRAWKLKQ